MPEISRFDGVVVRMYYRDHAPPHFHAEYGDFEIVVEIASGNVQGQFPRRELKSVLDWHAARRAELMEDWNLARQELPLRPIPPLE
jgi:hypothetical protein